ncbi:hypothetical protein JCM33374_g6616 [Metschnikowia sp. JCM 33374]|nr:hypothetical protein JCM33374_g6616 [Metschnikowia sp. JCM 33374]
MDMAQTAISKEDKFQETAEDTSPILSGPMKTRYESRVGSINWAANNTRPDLPFAANPLESKASQPAQRDFTKLIHCLGYVSKTLDQNLGYRRGNNRGNNRGNKGGNKGGVIIETFSDASVAPDADVKSTSGMATYVNGNLVKGPRKKQNNITRSTAVAVIQDNPWCMLVAEPRLFSV